MLKARLTKMRKVYKRLPPLRAMFKQRTKEKAAPVQEEIKAAVHDIDLEEEVPAVVTMTVGDAMDNIVEILVEYGILNYFRTRNKSEQEGKTIVKRYAHFLCWSYSAVHNTNMITTTHDIIQWLMLVIKEKYELLLHYSSYLQDRKQLKAATVSKYISAVESCCIWVTMFAPMHMRLPMGDIEGVKRVAQLVRSNQAQRNKQVRSHITLEEKVRLSQLPAGGLPALQQAVLQEVPWARQVRQHDIDDTAYRRYMQLLFAALYVCSPNGRQSGVVDIKYRQAEELLQQCYTTSTQFKTHNKYGYQPVTVEGTSHELLAHYVSVVRPQVRRHLQESYEEPLWLTYTGEAELDVGRLVTSFFTRTCALTVTITAIRSLVETTMHKKYKEGKITDAQRTAVQNINGHSSETTKAYYLLEDRADDVLCSRGVLAEDFDAALMDFAADITPEELLDHLPALPGLDHMHSAVPLPLQLRAAAGVPEGEPPARSPTLIPRQYVRQQPAPPQAIDWGTRHPDYNNGSKDTAIWTHDEKIFLGRWCADYRAAFPEARAVVAKCLQHIRTNPAAISIFHKHHTLNSARLRNGHRQYEKDVEDDQRTYKLRAHVSENDNDGRL